MPEPHHRCMTCRATLAAHEDPEVETCSSFTLPQAADMLLDVARTVGNDQGRPIQVVLLADARAALAQALAQAEADLEAWGAFDYMLLVEAEKLKVEADGLDPIELVQLLIRTSYQRGVRAACVSEGRC